ncbi:glycosyltransferase [Singulisphaera sp. PoT]|uniref:glycosyltransferase n=1 Tax=Singulisphaera sp. PoT TaxID=3411797 RepID=UPI003BF49D33
MPMLTVVSRSWPPQVQGSPILLSNLFSDYPGELRAIAGYTKDSPTEASFTPPCPTHYLRLPRVLAPVYDGLFRRRPGLMCRGIQGSILNAVRRSKAQAVFGVFPYEDYLVASYRAARKLRLPFYAHMHDLWQENRVPGTRRGDFAAKWEPFVLKGATRVLCMTEAMQEHYERKYKIRTELLPHCIRARDLTSAPKGMRAPKMEKPTVLFVGSVSKPMNEDALRVLARSSELLPPDYDLLFCTASNEAALAEIGIRSSRLQARYVTRSEVQRLQSEAHVLVAPLSFKDGSADEVRTVFSTKLLEYLVSGRPIVVFAPGDSHHARSARDRGWGYVVDEDSPEALAAGIRKVATDEALAASLVEGALREARSRDSSIHAARLNNWVMEDAAVTVAV